MPIAKMRTCEGCRVVLDDSSRFCPKCGKPVSDETSSAPSADALVASANLHRIRGEWDEAVLAATEAFKLDPNNADVASLLGRIYEHRAIFEDALVWYQMAVELNPNSTADKEALERVKQRLAAAPAAHGPAAQKQTKLWAAVLAGTLLAILFAALVLPFGRSRAPAPVRTVKPPSKSSGYTTTQPPTGTSQPSSQTVSSDLAGQPPAAPSQRTPAETAIRTEIAKSGSLQSIGASVDDVIADPRNGSATVIVAMPSKTLTTRVEVIRAAWAAAKAAFEANADVKMVTVRCMIAPPGSTHPQVGFVGDIARLTAQAQGASPDDQQLLRSFSEQWWNPQITPSQP